MVKEGCLSGFGPVNRKLKGKRCPCIEFAQDLNMAAVKFDDVEKFFAWLRSKIKWDKTQVNPHQREKIDEIFFEHQVASWKEDYLQGVGDAKYFKGRTYQKMGEYQKAASLYGEIEKLAQQSGLRKKLSHHARKTIAYSFSLERSINKIKRILTKFSHWLYPSL